MLVRNLESNIEDTEGFEVNFLHPSGTDVKGHEKIQGDYPYEQKARCILPCILTLTGCLVSARSPNCRNLDFHQLFVSYASEREVSGLSNPQHDSCFCFASKEQGITLPPAPRCDYVA